MGILRSREELLPVTCAVLKEGDRESFFSDIRRKVGGNMDRVAKTVGVPVSTLQDWVNGAANIPYIALQRLASEFGIEMPPVTELRREYQQIVPTAAPRRPAARMPSHPGPVGGAGRDQARREPRREARRDAGHESGGREYEPLRPAAAPEPAAPAPADRPARKERGARRGRRGADARPAKAARPERAPAPRPAAGPRVPKLSEEAAYWAGATIALGRRDADLLIVAADKRIGQNYAATWAALCHDLFGVKAALSMTEDHLCQEARLPVAGLEEFIGRLDLKPDAPRPPAPRWAWSNPDWKKAFLKGLVDASAEFRRTPALQLAPLGETLKRSTEKLLASFGLTPKSAEDGSLVIEGTADLEKYASAVGTDNLKLRDQLKAFFRRPAGDSAAPAEGAPAPAGKGRGRRRRGRRGGRGRPEAAPAAAQADPIAEAPQDGLEAPQGDQAEPAPAEAPEPRELPSDERPPEV